MKTIVVKQPWAELIACGRKSIELRTWKTGYRGRLLILAAAKRATCDDARRWNLVGDGVSARAVAIVDLVDVREAVLLDSVASCVHDPRGHFAWQLANATRLPVAAQLPTRGRLGIYDTPPELLRDMRMLGAPL